MNAYLIFKSVLLIAVISWMVGLLYLPRIFVYHSETTKDDVHEVFKIMERRLFVYIMNPAMILSWLFGFLLLHTIGIGSLKETWMISKLILVISLTFYHFFLFNCLNRSLYPLKITNFKYISFININYSISIKKNYFIFHNF